MANRIIRPRRGIKSLWDTYKSRIYRVGEMLVESPESGVGTGPVNIKFGDGVTDYENLPYAVEAPISQCIEGSTRPLTSGAGYDAFTQLNDEKINYTDIVNNLESTDIDLPLSANMGNSIQTRLNKLSTVIYEYDGTTQRYFNYAGTWSDTLNFSHFETLEFHIVFLSKNYVLLTSTNSGGQQCGVYFNCCHDDGHYRSIAGRFSIAGRYITNAVFQIFAINQSNTSSVSVRDLDLSTITVNKIIGHNKLL